jgi:hypothetical protein
MGILSNHHPEVLEETAGLAGPFDGVEFAPNPGPYPYHASDAPAPEPKTTEPGYYVDWWYANGASIRGSVAHATAGDALGFASFFFLDGRPEHIRVNRVTIRHEHVSNPPQPLTDVPF